MKLEVNKELADRTGMFGDGKTIVMMTPSIDEDYWTFRVKLHEDQAVVGFPKFGTIGIGFAQEDDWNTNLPFHVPTEEILNHIWYNHKYDEITKDDTLIAIEMIRQACMQVMEE